MNRGMKVLQTFALPLGYNADCLYQPLLYYTYFQREKVHNKELFKIKRRGFFVGAGNETRTRDIHLGKVTLYH